MIPDADDRIATGGPIMEYMLIFTETEPQFGQRFPAWGAYIGAMQQAGVIRDGRGLQPPHTGTTVRLVGGNRQVQDGPFVDAKEQLAGYVIVEVPSLDEAIEWAAKAPSVDGACVEVRPVLPPMQM
jgi:hypothetical protein